MMSKSKRVVITEAGTILEGEEYCYRSRDAAVRASRRWFGTPYYREYCTSAGEGRWLAREGCIVDESEGRRYTLGPRRTLVEVVVVRRGDEGEGEDEWEVLYCF